MKQLQFIGTIVALFLSQLAFAQTNPTPHDLSIGPFIFTGFDNGDIIDYPASSQGWRFGSEPQSTEVGPATGDRDLSPFSAGATSGNIKNEEGAGLSFLNSGSNHIGALVVALDNSGRENLTATWTVEDIRTGSTRQNGMLLQYRLDDEGDFTTIGGSSYLSDPEDVKAPETFSGVALPAETNNADLVQVRWLYFFEAGSGARDRIRLNDITLNSDAAGGSSEVEITFQVDMSQFAGVIDASGMHLAGNFESDAWSPAARPMTDAGDGLWTWTESMEPGFELEYKFVLGNDWAFGDENMQNAPCSAPGTSNRSLMVPSVNTTLAPVCYESCDPCDLVEPGAFFELTFQVDASQIDMDPAGIYIAGNFNGFDPEPMTDAGGGAYIFTTLVESGTTVLWKYLNGASFDGQETVPADCGADDGFGGFNRTFDMPEADTALDLVCFSSCEVCEVVEPGEEFALTFQVDASLIDLDPAGIHIAGNFNGFDPEPMTDAGDGVYTLTAQVEAGTTVLWKYLNGDSFDGQETVPAACGADDGFGGFNRTFDMPEADTDLDLVCFGACTNCEGVEPGETFSLTFQVDGANLVDINPAGIHIAGSFNGFNPEPMTSAGGTIYTFTVEVEAGETVLYKYTNSPDFSVVENVPAECGVDDGFGGFNRFFDMPEQNTTLDIVCFGSCEGCQDPGELFTLIFQVDASQIDIAAEGLYIAGSFNGFSPEAMQDGGNGIYTFMAEVQADSDVLWKYLNGANFDGAETVPAECGSPDGFGGFNRIFVMPDSNFTLDIVCFGSCAACTTSGETFNLVFQVDASNLINIDNEGIFIAGDFNGFVPEQMETAPENVYTFATQIEGGSTVTWKYVNGPDIANAELVPQECGEGFGDLNRVFNMPNIGQVLPVVCFGSCEACKPDFVFNSEKPGNLSLYPNPNRGDFQVIAPENGAVDLRVFDLSGRMVHANRFITTEGDAFNYAHATLESGYYIVEMTYGDKRYSARMVVQP